MSASGCTATVVSGAASVPQGSAGSPSWARLLSGGITRCSSGLVVTRSNTGTLFRLVMKRSVCRCEGGVATRASVATNLAVGIANRG